MIFIDACFRKKTPYTPIWMMRQAGRYLSEYQESRKKAGSFLELCKNSDLATEVTLQPVEVLGVDAAILFSDILVVPLEMGLNLEFIPKKGPHFLETITDLKSVESLKVGAYKQLNYVYDTISQTRQKLSKEKALIGFCGSPWTLATYMIEGEGSKSYAKSKKMLYSEPEVLKALLEKLSLELIEYLSLQIQAGVNAVMIFDSWASALEKEAYMAGVRLFKGWVIPKIALGYQLQILGAKIDKYQFNIQSAVGSVGLFFNAAKNFGLSIEARGGIPFYFIQSKFSKAFGTPRLNIYSVGITFTFYDFTRFLG